MMTNSANLDQSEAPVCGKCGEKKTFKRLGLRRDGSHRQTFRCRPCENQSAARRKKKQRKADNLRNKNLWDRNRDRWANVVEEALGLGIKVWASVTEKGEIRPGKSLLAVPNYGRNAPLTPLGAAYLRGRVAPPKALSGPQRVRRKRMADVYRVEP